MSEDDKKEVPISVMANLLWLESKQVLRGFKSELFPDLTPELALRIRTSTPENVEVALREMLAAKKQEQ